MFLAWTLLCLTTDMSEIFITLMFTVRSSFQGGATFFHLNKKQQTPNLGMQSHELCGTKGYIPFALSITYCTMLCEILQSCWLLDRAALEKRPAQSSVTAADWMSWSQALCFLFDRRVWNSWVKSSLRLYLRRHLWWWLMTGIAFNWVNDECHSCRELITTKDPWRKCCFIGTFF